MIKNILKTAPVYIVILLIIFYISSWITGVIIEQIPSISKIAENPKLVRLLMIILLLLFSLSFYPLTRIVRQLKRGKGFIWLLVLAPMLSCALAFISFEDIARQCIPSFCKNGLCTADCGGTRTYGGAVFFLFEGIALWISAIGLSIFFALKDKKNRANEPKIST